MLETKLLDELNPRQLSQQKEPTVSNLLYNQRVLDRHIQRIKDNLIILKAMDSKVWPQKELEEHQQRIVDEAATNLKCDYEYLLSRSLTLSEQCSRGMQVVMNNAMIKESRDAIKQAEGLAKLTRLAFIFVPLSFTTSFFGMNFIQFGTGSLSIWMWFVVSTPILFVSLVSMRLDIASSITIVLKILKGIFQRGDLKGSDYEA
ncbi:hypothetical protein N7504_010832 [Penicillium tannophilum]|nr:hypothetical protein N7504_010832 [Penicillium tannophilum]